MRMKCMHSIILLIRSSNHKMHNHLSLLWKLKRLNWISQCTIYILPDLNCIWICFERLQLTEEFFCNKKTFFIQIRCALLQLNGTISNLRRKHCFWQAGIQARKTNEKNCEIEWNFRKVAHANRNRAFRDNCPLLYPLPSLSAIHFGCCKKVNVSCFCMCVFNEYR